MISMSMLAVGMMSGGRMRTSTAIRKKTSGTAIFVESLFSDCVWRNLEPFHGLSFLSPFYLMFVEITVVKYLTWTVENATTLICLILCIKTVFK